MLKAVREYLSFAGVQYRNPDKAGDEREKMLTLRRKGQEARKAFTELVKTFQATEENRRTLREKVRSQEVRKVLVKSDVSLIENQSVEAILEKLEDAYTRLLPYYEVTRE